MTSFEGKAIAPVQDELIEGDDDYSSEDDADEDIYMDILDCMYVCMYVRITIYGACISSMSLLSWFTVLQCNQKGPGQGRIQTLLHNQ